MLAVVNFLKQNNMSKLAIKIWEKHIENFDQFDLINSNGNSLENETKTVSLFSALITLNEMSEITITKKLKKEIENAKLYLYGSKYYSEANADSSY